MIGVAIKKENRAAASWLEAGDDAGGDRQAGARKAGDQREALGDADRQCALPVQLRQSAARLAGDIVGEIEDEPVDDQHESGERRGAEGVAEQLAEAVADDHRRDRRQHDQGETGAGSTATAGPPVTSEPRKANQSRQK